MSNFSKQAVRPYEPLIDFANAEITQDMGQEVKKLQDFPSPHRRAEVSLIIHYDQSSLRKVQRELQEILRRLTDPRMDVRPPHPLLESASISPEKKEELRASWVATVKQEPDKDLHWLWGKIRTVPMQAEMLLEHFLQNLLEDRMLLTDRVAFYPFIEDLRSLVYSRHAELWADGFLPRIGRCQNKECQKFFLAKTARKKRLYCSQERAQRPTAAERTKDTRARRATWESIREDLEHALERRSPGSVKKAITKAERAFVEAYPRQKGPGYEEGKRLFARAKEQLRQL